MFPEPTPRPETRQAHELLKRGRNPVTEATPPPEKKERSHPRDAAFWAMKVERLEVSDVPEGAANVNVQGRREVGALQGFGRLWQKTYRLRLTGVEVTPEEAVKVWKERFPEFQPPNSRFYPSMAGVAPRSEEHTSELQSRQYLVCRLLLEKKKNNYDTLTCSHILPLIKAVYLLRLANLISNLLAAYLTNYLVFFES